MTLISTKAGSPGAWEPMRDELGQQQESIPLPNLEIHFDKDNKQGKQESRSVEENSFLVKACQAEVLLATVFCCFSFFFEGL